MAEKPHSRRKFLKYAGAGVAAGAIAVVGYGISRYWPSSPTTSPGPNGTISTPASPFPTTSSTTSTSELYTLKGRIIKDLNMNGKQDMDETGIPNVYVTLNKVVKSNGYERLIPIATPVTDSGGDYKIDVPAGDYRLLLVPPDQSLKYMCTSPADLRPLTGFSRDFEPRYPSSYDITISEEEDVKQFDIGASYGWATEPFLRRKDYDQLRHYVDVDPRIGYVRDWSGGQAALDSSSNNFYAASLDTPICALAPGVVIEAEDLWPDSRSKNPLFRMATYGNHVVIDHENGFMSVYSQLSKLNVKPRELTLEPTNPSLQRVNRGEIVGYLGDTGMVVIPNLRQQIQKYVSRYHYSLGGYAIDSHRDLYYKPETGWGMGDLCFSNPISIYTEDNNPHFPT